MERGPARLRDSASPPDRVRNPFSRFGFEEALDLIADYGAERCH